jgi:hypothetical protein
VWRMCISQAMEVKKPCLRLKEATIVCDGGQETVLETERGNHRVSQLREAVCCCSKYCCLVVLVLRRCR